MNAAGGAPRPASDRARLPARTAARNSADVAGPAAPSSSARRCAARTCPRICGSPTTIESSPAATRKRCSTACSS